MNIKLPTICLLLLSFQYVYSQNFEFRLVSGLGISNETIDTKSDWRLEESLSKSIPISADINYTINPDKRLGFSIGSGVTYTSNQYFYDLKSLEYGYNILGIPFVQNFIGVPIRVAGEWKFYNLNSLGLQYEIQQNFTLRKEQTLSGNGNAIYGSLTYAYTLTNRTQNFSANGISLYWKTQISKEFFLISTVGYTAQGISGSYDYHTNQTQTLTDDQTGFQVHKNGEYFFENEETKSNLISFKLGITKTL